MDYTEATCDVSSANPPGLNSLPEFGELYKKRHAAMANNAKMFGYNEGAKSKKRKICLAEPLKPQCIPEQILLPIKRIPSEAVRYLETDAPNPTPGNEFMKTVRVHKGKIEFPGWLVELTNPQLQSVVDSKDILGTGKPLCDLLDPLYQAIIGLDSGITFEEVEEIMRRVPLTSKGWSFSHFMFIAGNPSFAKKKGVLSDPMLWEGLDCKKDENDLDSTSKSKPKGKGKVKVIDRLYQLPRVEKDSWPPKQDKKSGSDESGYSLREQLFYSGLLYCEMYDTMQEMVKIYMSGGNIPEPREKLVKRLQETGFGASDIGTRKLGFAEWDRPLPPLPKVSPYVSNFPIVGVRTKYVRPSGRAYMYKRSITEVQPIFLSVKASQEPKEKATLKVLANASRVKGILALMASQGNCLGLLPNVVSIFHLSDTLLQKMQEIRPKDWKSLPKLHRGNENNWITQQAKNLFRPHGLPLQIAQIPQLITFSDGLKLREICKQVRLQHWSYICVRKEQFRQTVWPMMHVDRIPCGNLRENFIYAFQTLLPAKTYFPVIRSDPLPW